MELKKNCYDDAPLQTEQGLMKELLPTEEGAVWMELGCGPAKAAQVLAAELPQIHIVAYEIDEQQHAKNLELSSCPPNFAFGKAGMQDFPLQNEASVDAVVMLKSLHHVPKEYMKDGFDRIHRVLKPGGKLFICEPVFHGDFNEVLRLFHDEEQVRSDAFATTKQVIESGAFRLAMELHFQQEKVFPRGFTDFDEQILHSTFNDFKLTPAMISTVKERFQKHEKHDGSATFLMPMRLDLLVKKSG